MQTSKELEDQRKQKADLDSAKARKIEMDRSYEKWAEPSTPERQMFAFQDGFYEGWQAARKYFEAKDND